MNKPTPFGKTYKEYTTAVTNFNKVQKVEFGIVQDMQKVSDTMKNIIKQSNSTLDAAESEVGKVKTFLKESKSDLQKYYNVIEKNIVALGKEQDSANKLESEAEKAANDLGIREEDLPGYADMVSRAELADKTIVDGDEILNEIDKILANL